MNTVLRKAEIEDFGEIVILFRQLWPGKILNSGRLLALFRSMISSDGYALLCAEKNGRIVGFASLAVLQNFWQEGQVMYITTMIVDEKHRRTGIGKAVMNHIIEAARQKGCSKIELESAFHRADAHAFYENMGFKKRAHFFSKDI